MVSVPHIFDRNRVFRQRSRALKNLSQHNFLIQEAEARIAEHIIEDMNARFSNVLISGSRTGTLAILIKEKTDHIIQADFADNPAAQVIADDESLPFAHARFDLIISLLQLHWVNDLPGALIQLHRSLKPGGLMLGVVFGGQTLQELKLAQAGMEGAMHPRVSPFLEVKDGGMLLQRAGFTGVAADNELIKVRYSSVFGLARDICGMGEASALLSGAKSLSGKSFLTKLENTYPRDSDHKITASFELITLRGWRE